MRRLPLGTGDTELAERLHVPLQRRYTPFAAVLPGRPQHRHAALAAALRRGGRGLVVAQGEQVAGLIWGGLAPADLGVSGDHLLVIGQEAERGELLSAREDVAVLAEHGRRAGLSGLLKVEDHLLEIIAGRSPRLLLALRRRLLGPMAAGDRTELAHTLQTLLENNLDRAATSAALHVHRNTLAYRMRRIQELSGLDLSRPRDVACAYMALADAGQGEA